MRNEKWKTNFSLLISLFFEPLVGLDIRKTCQWLAFKAFIHYHLKKSFR